MQEGKVGVSVPRALQVLSSQDRLWMVLWQVLWGLRFLNPQTVLKRTLTVQCTEQPGKSFRFLKPRSHRDAGQNCSDPQFPPKEGNNSSHNLAAVKGHQDSMCR